MITKRRNLSDLDGKTFTVRIDKNSCAEMKLMDGSKLIATVRVDDLFDKNGNFFYNDL